MARLPGALAAGTEYSPTALGLFYVGRRGEAILIPWQTGEFE